MPLLPAGVRAWVCAGAIVGVLSWPAGAADPWYKLYEDAVKLIQAQGDLDAARKKLDEARALKPQQGRQIRADGTRFIAYLPDLWIATIHVRQKRPEAALPLLEGLETERLIRQNDPEYVSLRTLRTDAWRAIVMQVDSAVQQLLRDNKLRDARERITRAEQIVRDTALTGPLREKLEAGFQGVLQRADGEITDQQIARAQATLAIAADFSPGDSRVTALNQKLESAVAGMFTRADALVTSGRLDDAEAALAALRAVRPSDPRIGALDGRVQAARKPVEVVRPDNPGRVDPARSDTVILDPRKPEPQREPDPLPVDRQPVNRAAQLVAVRTSFREALGRLDWTGSEQALQQIQALGTPGEVAPLRAQLSATKQREGIRAYLQGNYQGAAVLLEGAAAAIKLDAHAQLFLASAYVATWLIEGRTDASKVDKARAIYTRGAKSLASRRLVSPAILAVLDQTPPRR